MSEYQLNDNAYIMPTPLGVYCAVSSQEPDPARHMLFELMDETQTRKASADCFEQWVKGDFTFEDVKALIYRMQRVGWIAGQDEPTSIDINNFDEDVSKLLSELSSEGKALLANGEGSYIARTGFTHEVAEQLAELGAEAARLQEKHERLIHSNMNLVSSALAIVDSGGYSQVGFWPLYIGSNYFVLVVQGLPLLHKFTFVRLVWTIWHKYKN